MSRARLAALRLVGFKSFAEKTTVEFGAGISAVVGPNGSGKSNLADALRWTLGEQGRSLRTRRSEDLIFAGSSARRAIGMADVTLVIDNSDKLLPVDFEEVEIGRRLYRSGENEYLLNRQRIRLKDLTELLDAGNLADNAFLFIGQGMVDQALALRPEERRPLFEEAAGVRRHERRRRQAEGELAEAEANLERLRDLLAELRPQAKRLAAQAEQLQARRSAGAELAEALLDAARSRWVTLSLAVSKESREVEKTRVAADAAMAQLKAAEAEATRLTTDISRRAEAEHRLRRELDKQREELTALRVNHARLETETAAQMRDVERLAAEQKAAEERRTAAVANMSVPVAEPDPAITTELEYVERQLAEIDQAAAGADKGSNVAEAALRRRELEAHERRLAPLETQLATARTRLDEIEGRRLAALHEVTEAERGLEAATREEKDAATAVVAARTAADAALAARTGAQARLAQAEADAAAVRGRLRAIDAALAALSDEGLARAARARGAPLVAEGLEIEPRFRAAVSAALGAAASAYLVDEAAVTALAARRGSVALSGAAAKPTPAAALAAITDAASAAGGGRLGEGIRRDPQAHVTKLIERTVWLPDLAAALGIRTALPAGWRAVTLAGEVIADDGIVQLAAGESVLDQRAQRDTQAKQLESLEETLSAESRAAQAATDKAAIAASATVQANERHEKARRQFRSAEETERLAQRRVEQLVRESTWQKSQLERQETEATALRDLVERIRRDVTALEAQMAAASRSTDNNMDAAKRQAELRDRAATLRRQVATHAATTNDALEAPRRAEVTLAIDEARLRDLAAETQRTRLRDAELAERRAQLEQKLALASQADKEAAAALEAAYAGGAEERAKLAAAEQKAHEARESLREHENRSRSAEVRALEARLLLDQSREGLLVELAAIGDDGVAALTKAAGDELPTEPQEADPAQMEDLLSRTLERWSADKTVPEALSSGKLASLRRRFHELGAGNPFAVEEYAELKERLDGLEAQRIDVEAAIATTRELIASLGALINDQFRTTFAKLEDAFARRFHELFGGGEAQLSLTAPDDLSTTGIDIHARPPGKKRQPLSMLSGGERALTAVSLLLAMLEVRPVPFCVLDEVDAALDEANVGRFSRALRGLSDQTQFIVITHNRGTIEGADALYGITLGDDAVSRVVSLRLSGSPTNGGGPPNGHGSANAKQPIAVPIEPEPVETPLS